MYSHEKFLAAAGNRISTGSEFLWSCYGKNTYLVDAVTKHGSAGAVFSLDTLEVFEVSVMDNYCRGHYYRWFNPATRDAYMKEATARGIPLWEADEETGENWAETDSYDDILEKVTAILNDQPFNGDVIMNVELEDDVAAKLAEMAEAQNTTIEQCLVNILTQYAAKIIEEKGKTANE